MTKLIVEGIYTNIHPSKYLKLVKVTNLDVGEKVAENLLLLYGEGVIKCGN